MFERRSWLLHKWKMGINRLWTSSPGRTVVFWRRSLRGCVKGSISLTGSLGIMVTLITHIVKRGSRSWRYHISKQVRNKWIVDDYWRQRSSKSRDSGCIDESGIKRRSVCHSPPLSVSSIVLRRTSSTHWSNLATHRLQCLQCLERKGCLAIQTRQKFCPFILPWFVSSSTVCSQFTGSKGRKSACQLIKKTRKRLKNEQTLNEALPPVLHSRSLASGQIQDQEWRLERGYKRLRA